MAREQRRLAAIIAADVVGYSRLMERDEADTLACRVVKVTGDGALVEFASAADADAVR